MRQAKFTRALMRGGVAERRADGAYRVWRSRNRRRRALGVMHRSHGDALRSDGKLALLDGETSLYTWAGEVVSSSPRVLPPPARNGAQAKRRPARTLLVRALDLAVDDRERTRLTDALGRFSGDAECAASGGSLTMNWQALATGRRGGAPRPTDHLPGYARARAQRRLDQISNALGDERFQILDWTVVQEMSTAELARRLNMQPPAVPEFLAGLLRDLANAYDQAVDGM